MNKPVMILLTFVLLLVPASPRTEASRYRTNTIDPRARRVAAEIQRGVFADPQRYIGPLIQSLTRGLDDDFHKVKVLHDWVADNIAYDVKSYLANARVESDWKATLKNRKAVCYGYGALFAEMCRLAGVPCERISGYGRGYRFGTGRAESAADANHAWNAVHVKGHWHLVDVTWDAGHVGGRAFRKEYGTAYLFLAPQQFLYTHFPTEAKWQLLDPPRTTREFLNLPYLRGIFFEHGLRLVTPLRRVSRAGKSVQFTLEVPAGVLISTQLKAPNGAELQRRTLVQREGNRCRVLATFPRAGHWKVQLYSKRRRDPGSLSLAARLEFQSTGGTTRTFPKTYSTYDSLGGCIYSPLYVPLQVGKPLLFRVRVRGTDEVHLAIGDRPWLQLQPSPSEKDVYQLTADVPRGLAVRLTAKNPGAGGAYWTLVDFTPGRE